MYKFNVLILTGLLYLASCHSPQKDHLAHIRDADTKIFFKKVLDSHGGLENWRNIQSLKYSKTYELYTDSGHVEKSVEQYHTYKYNPQESIHIVSHENDHKKEIIFEDGQMIGYMNDTLIEASHHQSLINSMQSSLFVIAQPFKLADEGPELYYEGLTTLPMGKKVHVLKATYDANTHDNLTTSDTWWVYFDTDTYLMTGYMVRHRDHYSLVQNLETSEINGFHFPQYRKSWRVDKNGEILYLRAEYRYNDFELL